MRRPAPELIERHFAGHVGGGGAQAAAASGVVEGVLLLLLLPEPFIVVVLLSLFWMLPLCVDCRVSLLFETMRGGSTFYPGDSEESSLCSIIQKRE